MRNLLLGIISATVVLDANAFSGSLSSSSVPRSVSQSSSVFIAQILNIELRRHPDDASIAFVSQNSPFRDSYAVSRVAGSNVSAVVSTEKVQPRDADAVRNYCRTVLKLEDKEELDDVVGLLVRADQAIVQWQNTLLNFAPEQRLHLARAADDLRLKQFRLESNLFQIRQQQLADEKLRTASDGMRGAPRLNSEALWAIMIFDHELKQVTNHGRSKLEGRMDGFNSFRIQ